MLPAPVCTSPSRWAAPASPPRRAYSGAALSPAGRGSAWCSPFVSHVCAFGRMSGDTCPALSYCPSPLGPFPSPTLHLWPVPTTDVLSVSRVLPFPECHIAGVGRIQPSLEAFPD